MKIKKHTKLHIWQQKAKSGTEKCRCGERRGLTVDHIVPCELLKQFMLSWEDTLYDYEENFEIMCMYCNRMKGARIDVRNPKTYIILEKIIKQAKDYYMKP